MRTLVLLVWLSVCTTALASGLEPQPGRFDREGIPYQGGDRDVCWSEPPLISRLGGSSEIISMYGVESKVANDFVVAEPFHITRVRWWGNYYQYSPGYPMGFPINLQFYTDAAGIPGTLLFEFPCVDGHDVLIHDFGADLIFEQWADVNGPCMGVGTYWFVAQCCDHPFPPQYARVAAQVVTGATSMFWSPFFGYPEWTPTDVIWGEAWDASQEFECEPCDPTAVSPSSWGRIRALYH